MIEKEKSEAIKHGVNLIDLIQSRGIKLTKKGKNYQGICPFHDDKTPSLTINPKENLWQCFGCGAAGDAIRFIELHDKKNFPDAVNIITDLQPELLTRTSSDRNKPKPVQMAVTHVKLLSRVIDFYHTEFAEDNRAKIYLAHRGITEKQALKKYKTGFSNGTLLNVLPNDGEVIRQLKEIGILNENGKEHFYGCVVFPLYDLEGSPAGIYGRRIPAAGSGPVHLYLPGKRSGIFNRQAAKKHEAVILTESVIDSLTLINAGLNNTVPCYGTNGLTPDHIRLFKQNGVKSIHICFDNDVSGKKAAKTIAEKLKNEGFRVRSITLPVGKDINEFFSLTANGKASFQQLIARGSLEDPKTVKEKKSPAHPHEVTESGFITTIDNRRYEVRGISRYQNRLRAIVKGIRTRNRKRRIHTDTVDFYSARSRAYFIKGLCDLFETDEKIIAEDMQMLMEQAENYQPPEKNTEKAETVTEADKAKALTFLKNPNLLDEVLSDFEIIGYTGEETNKLLCYIAAISRKMDEPLSMMIQSRSAAGKSYLQDTVLSLIPDDETIKYTRLTDQALFYKDADSLKHKILAIEELDGMNGAIYSIRSIQSSKKITIAYTGKDPVTGKLKTEENTVEGPLMVFITTTQVDIDGETASRFVFISIDESQDMTEKIMKKQRVRHTLEGMLNQVKTDAVIKKHKAANQLLRPLKVVNPYAELLTFNSKSLRARRDHTKYLNLIDAVAYLFQYQRTVHTIEYEGQAIEYINVTLGDIEKANAIADTVLGRCLDELSPPSKNLLILIRGMVLKKSTELKTEPDEYQFTRRDIRSYSGWSDFQVKTHIRQLEDLEYIYPVMGKKGKTYVYELPSAEEIKEEGPFLAGLIDMKDLQAKAIAAGITDEEPGG